MRTLPISTSDYVEETVVFVLVFRQGRFQLDIVAAVVTRRSMCRTYNASA